MARPKLPKPNLPDPTPTPEDHAQWREIQAEQAEEQQRYELMRAEGRDLLNQLLGRIQMAEAFSKFSVTVTTSQIAIIKESECYKDMKGQKLVTGHQFSGTWGEFCRVFLGKSREIVDEDIRNLEAFTEHAVEAMQQAGIGYRELRRLRRLPEDQRQALIEVAETEDRDSVLELAAELIAKERKAREDAEARLLAQTREHKAELDAKDRLIADKNAKLDELAEQDARRAGRSLDDLDREQAEALERATLDALEAFNAWRAAAAQVLWLREEDAPTWLREAVTTNLQRLSSCIGDTWYELSPYLPSLKPLRVPPVEPSDDDAPPAEH